MNLTCRLRAATGLDLTVATVERAVRERMRATGASLDYDPHPGTPEFDALVDLVVVPESWFLRDPAQFDTALRFVRAQPGRMVRVLSLPCAGGEEPYTLAMLLARAGIGPDACRIDAFDLSHDAIARARAGRYTRNAFRGDDRGLRERFFTDDGDGCVIGAEPRAYVAFGQANLFDLDPRQAGPYDLVFCRNLLIYFDAARQARAAACLFALLADDGLLLAGHAEAPALCRHGFGPATPRATSVLRKQGRRRARILPAAEPAAVHARPATPRPAAAPPVAKPTAAPPPRDLLADARRHANAGRLAEAEQSCRAALALRGDDAEAWFLLGLTAECAGRPQEADRNWRRCVYLDPDHYEALCALALLLEQRGDADAGAVFKRRAARVHARRGSTTA
ncbi:methyltransferase [Massilia sp. TW-1]|uniref:Methyltransferase n=1 Tax=Telluria antibiotica TaxID=2717319 RepID=A0ABX0PG38_9BURK|nr:CheR family methyltransferase [Telluria antibiotica]NIA55000.1 methyltransferase [Telluria antibiotica]